MNFFKDNEVKILGGIAIVILAFTGLRMAISITLEPGEEPSGVAALLEVEAPPVKENPAEQPQKRAWSFDGPTGKYDMASVNRGLQVYREVCSTCHSLNNVAFRNLPEIFYSGDDPEKFALAEEAAKAIAASYDVPDIDNFGDEVMRPAILADYFPAPFANANAAKSANGGKAPPDLSLMAKARTGGPDYIYSLLTGYGEPPADFEFRSGTTTYNPYFEGREIAMAGPRYEDAVEFTDGTEASVDQMALDVSNFLMWTAEPKLEDRHEMGLKVVIYTLLMTLFFFLSMKTIWRRIKK